VQAQACVLGTRVASVGRKKEIGEGVAVGLLLA
jgi:hypothetical protein